MSSSSSSCCRCTQQNMKLYDWIVFYCGKFVRKIWNNCLAENQIRQIKCDIRVRVCASWCELKCCRRQFSDNEIALPPVDWIEFVRQQQRWLAFGAVQIGLIVIHYVKLKFNTWLLGYQRFQQIKRSYFFFNKYNWAHNLPFSPIFPSFEMFVGSSNVISVIRSENHCEPISITSWWPPFSRISILTTKKCL